ncbi:hypothetical protein SAMN04515667_1885 [Formosa sp. Hel1_31_208]|uniref:hypothetical protein n=1 Tax=Formosa sp. Hel1_31_208 TaxID=1798225 RepID=UPI00087CD6E6|nr:hypothetical protein [Formosa sp. Hel1_31_208]SDS31095.1 hypothetical protein SAMN04515667_1885 [Formosa sp. Hel1_31_208]
MILIFCLGFLHNAIGQTLTQEKPQTAQELYDFHISKKKANKTAGWIVLGGGVAMIVGGLGINMSGGLLDNDGNQDKGIWLSYLGAATTAVSIPLFIASGKHNRKAKIELQNGAIGFNKPINYSGISIIFSF